MIDLTRNRGTDALRHIGMAALLAVGSSVAASASAAVIFSNSHTYTASSGGVITIDVNVHDNFAGDFGKYLWEYNVNNVSFDPNPGSSNGFSGFETALPAGVPDLADRSAPAGWIFDCCSGEPVEFDIRNSAGLGIMPGEAGVFSFTSLPRFITNSTGWFHTWQGDVQTDIENFAATSSDGLGPEVPDVLQPPIGIPAPATLALIGLGLAGLIRSARSRKGQ